MTKLDAADYDQECSTLARYLLGKVLARRLENGKILKGKIVETEAYPGGDDKGSISYKGLITDRNRPVYGPPGTSFVYSVYGMYHCFNISSRGAGAAVLLRALEPTENLEEMQSLRASMRKKKLTVPMKKEDLCNGPSKLCRSLNITKALNNVYMPQSDDFWVEMSSQEESETFQIVETTRIGIERRGKESVSRKWRYYCFGNPCVSKRDKISEAKLQHEGEST